MLKIWTSLVSAWRYIASNPAAHTTATPQRLAVAFLNEKVELVIPDHAVYELHFWNGNRLEWVKRDGQPKDKAAFSMDFSGLWAPEEWPGYASEQTTSYIRELLKEPDGRCSFAFRWIQSDLPTRYRMFLSTHRGSLDECERMFCLAARTFVSADNSDVEWMIEIRQSDDEPLNSVLWSHARRDCHLVVGGPPEEEFDDNQLRLLRVIHCYFMPFYSENARRYDAVVQQMWNDAGFAWLFAVPAFSSHERLEARLRLREWLEGKVAPEEIPALLGEA